MEGKSVEASLNWETAMMTFNTMMSAMLLNSIGAVSAAHVSDRPFVYTVAGVPVGSFLFVRRNPKANSAIFGKLSNGHQGFITLSGGHNSRTAKKVPPKKSISPNQTPGAPFNLVMPVNLAGSRERNLCSERNGF